jgi:glycine/D-amino acid oxidase-like deaminating enzyme
MFQETCFWLADSPTPKLYIGKPLPENSEVVVVGGGFTGTSIALRLAKGGVKVTLLEGETIGWGASSRNGGQALSCLPRSLTDLAKRHGRVRAREMFLASVRAADTVTRIVAEEKIDCDFHRNGHIEAASKPAHFQAFKEEQKTLKELVDFDVRIVPRSEIPSEMGTDAYYGLMVNERSAGLQPAKFVQGMATVAESAGVDIYEGVRVARIDPVAGRQGRFLVCTDRGQIDTREVVLAANAWNGQIVPQFRSRVFPAESFIIATEPLSNDLADRLIPHRRVVYDTKNMLAYYCLSADNRMVWGGERSATGVSASKNVENLRKGMVETFPDLESTEIQYYWGGTLGLTLDQNPHAGQVDGMWFSMCYVGHGVALATYLGEQVAKAILGEEYDNPFEGIKMPRVPYYEGKAWFVNLGKAWFRFLDWIG